MAIDPLPTADGPDHRAPQPLSMPLSRIVKNLTGSSGDTLMQVFGAWNNIVGERVAAHAKPAELRRGTLVLLVDDHAWASEIRWLEPQILERLLAATGPRAVTKIVVRLAAG